MSSKYAFATALREVRFLFCQTSEHSAATRYVTSLISPFEAFELVHLTKLSLFLFLVLWKHGTCLRFSGKSQETQR